MSQVKQSCLRIVFQNAGLSEIATLEQIAENPNRILRSERPILSELISANKVTAENVRFLISKGADVLLRDANGNFPVLFAVLNNKPEIFNVLVEAGGPDIVNLQQNYRADGCSLLHIAVYNGHRDITERLISLGGLLNARNKAGDTPLCDAVRTLNLSLASYLIEQGADVAKYEEETGASLIGLLRKSSFVPFHKPLEEKMEALLLQAGSRPPARPPSPTLSPA